MRILIVEDDIVSRTLLTGAITKWGHTAVAVQDGESALAPLSEPDGPKLVILDWNLPGISGLEVCKKIRVMEMAEPPHIIFLTSRNETRSIVEGLEAGASDYVTKPFVLTELWARIRVGQRLIEMQTALVAAQEKSAYEAMHDPLTGCLNRRAILEALQRENVRARRQNSRFAIGLCDIDHFKQINDTYGHQAGDDVLRGFVRTVEDSLRTYDLIGRYGGEEFLVVAPGFDGAEENGLFERLRARIADQVMETRSGRVSMTVSIGVVMATGSEAVDELLAAADSALYFAKKAGRNRVAFDVAVRMRAS